MTDQASITETAIRLLEFTLASYEHLCGLKKQPRMELMRLENAIEVAFTTSGRIVQDFLKRSGIFTSTGDKCPRVRTLIRYCELGDSPKEAVHRHFLVTHHGNKDAHRE